MRPDDRQDTTPDARKAADGPPRTFGRRIDCGRDQRDGAHAARPPVEPPSRDAVDPPREKR